MYSDPQPGPSRDAGSTIIISEATQKCETRSKKKQKTKNTEVLFFTPVAEKPRHFKHTESFRKEVSERKSR